MSKATKDRDWVSGENLTREQLKFRMRAFQKREANLAAKLHKALADNVELRKEVLRLRDQLGAKGKQAAAEAMGEFLQRIGREIANAG